MDFFLSSYNTLFATHFSLLHIVLPLGISFFTITQIAYLVDCYEGLVKERNLMNYTLFVTFFPHLIAGPILHHKEMMPQFANKRNKVLNYKNIAKGLFLFSIGLVKKVILADTFAKWANTGFNVVDSGESLNIIESWATSLSYTFQLYFDFSGYCDMAIGLGLLFNIMLPINFNSPYKSLNITEFWRRWHMTLGRFLKDYVYIPLGGNRNTGYKGILTKGIFVKVFTIQTLQTNKESIMTQSTSCHSDSSRLAGWVNPNSNLETHNTESKMDSKETTTQDSKDISHSQILTTALDSKTLHSQHKSNTLLNKILTLRNLFIVAFISGVWHGAGIGFIIWGTLHGSAMILHRIYRWGINSYLAKQKELSLVQSPLCHSKRSEGSLKDKSSNTESQSNNAKLTESIDFKKTDSKVLHNKYTDTTQTKQNKSQTTSKLDSNILTHSKLQAFLDSKTYKVLCWILTFNFINIAWIFFRAQTLDGACNLIKGMFGITWVAFSEKWYKAGVMLTHLHGSERTFLFLTIGFIVCLCIKNSIEWVKNISNKMMIVTGLVFGYICLEVLTANYTPQFLYYNF